MATKQSTVDHILKQIAGLGLITAKKMFGEFGVYFDGKIVAFICDDQLFVKPTLPGMHFIGDYTEGFPYPTAKPYLLISSEQILKKEWLTSLIQITARELPLPKKKPVRMR